MRNAIWEAIASAMHYTPTSLIGKWSAAGVAGVLAGVVCLAAMLRATRQTRAERGEALALEVRVYFKALDLVTREREEA